MGAPNKILKHLEEKEASAKSPPARAAIGGGAVIVDYEHGNLNSNT